MGQPCVRLTLTGGESCMTEYTGGCQGLQEGSGFRADAPGGTSSCLQWKSPLADSTDSGVRVDGDTELAILIADVGDAGGGAREDIPETRLQHSSTELAALDSDEAGPPSVRRAAAYTLYNPLTSAHSDGRRDSQF